jgi:MinD superfamily P-loop ATPase
MKVMPVIIQEKCDGCGLCVRIDCHCLILVDNVITFVETGECGWCTHCEAICPTGAISCPFDVVVE